MLKAMPRVSGQASFFYYDYGFKVEACKILPGEYFCYHEDIVLLTVLGSCVAACLYDRHRGVGGMNHFLLPEGDSNTGRFGVYAMELLINSLLKLGARKVDLECKIFGGGSIIGASSGAQVGEMNVRFVERFLVQENIPIVSRDVLGSVSRKVVFFPKSGKAMVKKLAAGRDDMLARSEQQLRGAAQVVSSKGGEVELF